MSQIRLTRTEEIDSVLSSLQERYPLLSEAEIIKMALSNQYHQETRGEPRAGERLQDPTKRFTKEEWQKKFAAFDTIRDQINPEDEEKLDQAIDRAVQEVRADTNKAYGKDPA